MKNMMNKDEIWVQQRYQNACVLNVMQMMLRQRNINCSLEDISKICMMHAMINRDDDVFSAGFLAFQEAKIYNLLLKRYQLQWVDCLDENIDNYLTGISRALTNSGSVLLSIPSNKLPYGAQIQNASRHALMLYAIDESGFHFLDSDGGCDRSKTYSYQQVKAQVDYSFTQNDFQKMMLEDRSEYRYAYITDDSVDSKVFCPLALIVHSIKVMDDYECIAKQKLDALINSDDQFQSQFYDFTYKMIRPLVNDFTQSLSLFDQRHPLIDQLNIWKKKTFQQMRQVKENEFEKTEIIALLKDDVIHCNKEIIHFLNQLLEEERRK